MTPIGHFCKMQQSSWSHQNGFFCSVPKKDWVPRIDLLLPCTGFGFGVWAIASVGCGLAPNFWILLICRVVMGAGEASIITLTGPFIDDVAPPAQKTLWFGVLNLVRPSPSPVTFGISTHAHLLSLLMPSLWRIAVLWQLERVRLHDVQFPTLGIAGGYIFGGLIGPALGWRYAFFIQVPTLL